jgi:hypothetical protein
MKTAEPFLYKPPMTAVRSGIDMKMAKPFSLEKDGPGIPGFIP